MKSQVLIDWMKMILQLNMNLFNKQFHEEDFKVGKPEQTIGL
jgi:hypothetical protein